MWKFDKIIGHKGPLSKNHPEYKGSPFNVTILWENGETSDEPLSVIVADDPASCAMYAQDNGLLDLAGWKQFRGLAKRQRNLFQQVNIARLQSFSTCPKYKYEHEITRDFKHAVEIDQHNRNTKWQDATTLELESMQAYNVFKDCGHKAEPPPGYKVIRVHLIYDIKHDGRHKARLVADGHLTDLPNESVYSSVVSLCGLRILLFLAELNGIEVWGTDIGNAYLEALTAEKVCIKAGLEFGPLAEHTLLIHKALYGLRSSGARWHDRLSDVLRKEGFQSCRAEPDIWMRKAANLYEYIAVYVDDLAFAVADPQGFVSTLKNQHNFKIKEAGPLGFHLGADFFQDEGGTLCIAPQKYIDALWPHMERCLGRSQVPRCIHHLRREIIQSLMIQSCLMQKAYSSISPLLGHFNG